MKSLVIDTELLVLFVVGVASRGYIAKHKRLHAYTAEDFDLLCELISKFDELVVTPNSLTETSNWLAYIDDPIKGELFGIFRSLIGKASEHFVPSKSASESAAFVRLGLTDSTLMAVSASKRVLVTSDNGLYLAAVAKNPNTLNFNHLREARGLV